MSERDFKTIFSRNLNKQLDMHGITQLELAKAIDVGTSSVSYWCKGIKIPRMDKIDAMCEYFGIKRSDLMEDSLENSNKEYYYLNDETKAIAQAAFENPDMKVLFDVARDISPDELKAHIEFMQRLKNKES